MEMHNKFSLISFFRFMTFITIENEFIDRPHTEMTVSFEST